MGIKRAIVRYKVGKRRKERQQLAERERKATLSENKLARQKGISERKASLEVLKRKDAEAKRAKLIKAAKIAGKVAKKTSRVLVKSGKVTVKVGKGTGKASSRLYRGIKKWANS